MVSVSAVVKPSVGNAVFHTIRQMTSLSPPKKNVCCVVLSLLCFAVTCCGADGASFIATRQQEATFVENVAKGDERNMDVSGGR